MAPIVKHFFAPRGTNLSGPIGAFTDEWISPSNYAFTILLLLGGDVVGKALAQLAGGWITPVAFSFGTLPRLLEAKLDVAIFPDHLALSPHQAGF